VDWTIYGALVFGFVCIAASTWLLTRRILRTWREFTSFQRALGDELGGLAASADTAARAAERQGGDQARLDESLARLRVTLARFAVLRNALDEVSETVGRFTAVVPRK
jgi:ABC-type transporter Mla subunit MlaD